MVIFTELLECYFLLFEGLQIWHFVTESTESRESGDSAESLDRGTILAYDD